MEPRDRRRASLQKMPKDELVEIVLRLQEMVQAERRTAQRSLEDGVAEGLRRARAAAAERRGDASS